MFEWDGCPHLKSNLEDVKINTTKYNWDFPFPNWGIEGSGKSMFSAFIGFEVDEHFSKKQVAIREESIKDVFEQSDKGQVMIVDEGGEWLFNRNWNKTENKNRVQDLFLMRRKGLIIIVNCPEIKSLDVYLRSGRLRFATNTWTIPVKKREDDGSIRMHRERGFFSLYTRKSVIQYFDKDYYLKSAFSERYPDITKYPEGKKFWDWYEPASKEEKDRIMKERNKLREEKSGEVKKKDVNRLLKGFGENRLWADQAEGKYLGYTE